MNWQTIWLTWWMTPTSPNVMEWWVLAGEPAMALFFQHQLQQPQHLFSGQ